ncbi:MAG: ATP synthase F1 subunit gamma [Spirochaetales bacterium]|nr:ATP synthase F1 subunit gamma [Spirochaetales bacterium]
MSNIRDLNRKIHSLRNMQKVMSAMNMIASIKLRKLTRLQDSLITFSDSLKVMRENIMTTLHHKKEPIIYGYKTIKKIHVIILTADKGLCGSHNNSIRKMADAILVKYGGDNQTFEFTCVGTKGINFCKTKQLDIVAQSPIHESIFTMDKLKSFSDRIFHSFYEGKNQLVLLLYNQFHSTIQQTPVISQLLPLSPNHETEETASINKYAGYTEPKEKKFLPQAARLYLSYSFQAALYHSLISEQAARMTAMENATNNSEDLINRYGRARNRARQASITNELIEIISGKEAMKG